MNLTFTARFKKKMQRLNKHDQRLNRQIQKTLQHLIDYPPAVPALRMKRVRGTDGVYECSVNMDIRMTFEFVDEGTILLRNIDHHDDALNAY